MMDFKHGGDLGFVEIYSWQDEDEDEIFEWTWKESINNGSGEGCNVGDTACAFNNADSIPNGGWPSYNKDGKGAVYSLERNAFTEMGINVTQLLGGVETPCFTSIIAKTRSSSSINSDLKDFVIGKVQFV